ncbi:MAG: PH domain-containing protein [Clostridium sp.]|uniref:PH domain-containing protein n=1 Tax=Clostridium sp. TaxID=1506 RepID=UPI003F309AD2
MAEILNTKKFTFYSEVAVPENLMNFVNGNERALFAVKTIRDAALFTDKKMLICDKQGLTGKKVEYYAIPYSKIVTYAIETAGHFDMDAEIKLVLAGGIEIELEFIKGRGMNDLLFKVFNAIDSYAAK